MLLIGPLLLFPVLSSAAVFSKDFENKLDSYIQASMKCHHIPGMTLSVVRGDEVWTKGYGKADIGLDQDVDIDTNFNIGSITKSFTAALLGILLSEKRMNWTAKVTDILGSQYEFVDPYRTKELTIRDLLSHRTGLARLDFGLDPVFPKSLTRTLFCKNLKYLPEERPMRDSYIYNNYMFMMLGHVAEVLGHDTWENLITKKLFQPLGMNRTSFLHLPSDVSQPNVAKPYMYIDGEFQNGTLAIYDLHPWEPAGAILSNAVDMAKWIKFHLNLGKSEAGVQVLSTDLMEDMHRVTSSVSGSHTKPNCPEDDISMGYGYAWRISEYRGFRKVWHSGAIGSYRSSLWTFPDMDFGIFTSVNGPRFGNDDSHHRSVTFYYISDHLLHLKPWLNESTACSYPEPWNKIHKTKVPEFKPAIHVNNPAELVGSYGNHLFPDIEISLNSTQLQMRSNIVLGILHPVVTDRFLYEVVYPLEYSLKENSTSDFFNVTFNRAGDSHTVNGLTLHLEVDLRYDKRPGPQVIG